MAIVGEGPPLAARHLRALAGIVVLAVVAGVLASHPPAAASEPDCPPGTRPEAKGGMYGDRRECVVIEDGRFDSGWRMTYEPADERHGSALRSRYEQDQGHEHHGHGDCRPTSKQNAFASWLVRESRNTLMARYLNKPWQAFADGFYAYPLPNTKWLHMFNPSRNEDGDFVASGDPSRGNPKSGVFNPARIESFMYGMTDQGLTPLGAMFVLPKKYKGVDPARLPNPTGCLLQWHNHTGAEGAASSGDVQNPTQSVWMSHVWTYGGLDPWGRDYDGSEPHAWFFAYRNIPAICDDDGGCI